MNSDEIIKIVKELCGPTEPYADSSIDGQREQNLRKLIDVRDGINRRLTEIVEDNNGSPFGSVQNLVKLSEQALDLKTWPWQG